MLGLGVPQMEKPDRAGFPLSWNAENITAACGQCNVGNQEPQADIEWPHGSARNEILGSGAFPIAFVQGRIAHDKKDQNQTAMVADSSIGSQRL